MLNGTLTGEVGVYDASNNGVGTRSNEAINQYAGTLEELRRRSSTARSSSHDPGRLTHDPLQDEGAGVPRRSSVRLESEL